jgi:LPXTG-site transpeptidase (sortase) family protein
MTRFTMNRKSSLSILLAALLIIVMVTGTVSASNVSIRIPALGVDTGIVSFPLNGVSWDIDPWTYAVGHMQGTAWFDGPGNVALAGHSVMPDMTAGVFVALHTLNRGDEIIISVGDQERVYAVSEIANVGINDLTVLYPTSDERLTLITCDAASYDPETQVYHRRHAVIAHRVR